MPRVTIRLGGPRAAPYGRHAPTTHGARFHKPRRPWFNCAPIALDGPLSFKDPNIFRSAEPTFFPKQWVWTNYDTVFSDSLFTSAVRNSVGVSLIATGLAVVVAMFAAYAIARLDFPGKKLLLSLALGIAMFPQAALVGRCSTCGGTSGSMTPGSA